MIGRRLLHYQIIEKLGQGAMGVVFRARDLTLGRDVALKLLPLDLAGPGPARVRFAREARAAAALSHPNVAAVYAIEEAEGETFIVMEYVEGDTLAAVVKPLPDRELADIALQVASGLDAAHEKGIIHRDIKPSNLMRRRDGRVEITDFGLARLSGASRLTSTGASVGTLAYLSPEQASGAKPDPRSDLFSLGVVAYELATGRLPFSGDNAGAVIFQILNSDPPPPRSLRPELNPGLEAVILRCLVRNIEDRYASASELASDLRAWLAGAAPPIASSAPTIRMAARPRGRKWKVAATVLAVVVVAATVICHPLRNAGQINSLAVLPFVNAGPDTTAEYLSDGITEELIDNLSRLPALRVIARGSVFQFKGTKVDPQAAGRRMGVRAVVVGEVKRWREQLRISVELIEVRDNRHLWGTRYDRPANDLLGLEGRIAQDITDNLRLRLSGHEKQQLAKPATTNPDAYEQYLKGLYALNKEDEPSYRVSAEYLKRAIALDPGFARAHAAVSRCYASQITFDPRLSMPLARTAALKALSLDPMLAEGHLALAKVLWQFDYAWAEADQEFRRGIVCSPGYEPARTWHSYFLFAQLRVDEGAEQVERALELNPLSPLATVFRGCVPFYRRDYAKAAEVFREAVRMSPEFVAARGWLAWSLVRSGRAEEAIPELRLALESDTDPVWRVQLAIAQLAAGHSDSAQVIRRALEKRAENEYVSPFAMGKLYAALGEKDLAFERLEEGHERRDIPMVWIRADPDIDPLRSDPRYVALLKKMNLPTN